MCKIIRYGFYLLIAFMADLDISGRGRADSSENFAYCTVLMVRCNIDDRTAAARELARTKEGTGGVRIKDYC